MEPTPTQAPLKYLVVTGGTVSGLGKGTCISSVGVVLRMHGLRVTSIKIDPYLNVDAGTMSPFEHGEVYVLEDGGEVDLDLVQEWVSKILQEKGADIFRMKGVLAIANAEQKFVYQAVHMIFNGNFDDEKWGADEEKKSKLVFIGKNLNHTELKAGFEACVLSPELLEKKKASLRFTIGSKVQCNTGGGWKSGQVVTLWYRDEFMPPGMVAPYQVQLDDGSLIYAPSDQEELIRKA